MLLAKLNHYWIRGVSNDCLNLICLIANVSVILVCLRATVLLFNIRKYVSLRILRSIYFAIFNLCLSYCCLVWAQNYSTIQRIIILQKRDIIITNLQPKNFHTSPLFKQNSILKFRDEICSENMLFVRKFLSLNNLLQLVFNAWFSVSSDQHNYKTSIST